MDDQDEVFFSEYANTLIYETCLPDDLTQEEISSLNYTKILDKTYTNNLSQVSSYYIYTNTPPHGYGTQAPKVAETVSRSYSFNKKPVEKREIEIEGYKIERMHWDHQDGPFPSEEIHGNYIPSEMRIMCENFLKEYHLEIDSAVDTIMKKLMSTNSDILTSGRQTFCPFTNQSVTAAVAYKRAYDFLRVNVGFIGMSCFEWIVAIMKCFELKTINYMTIEEIEIDKLIYDKDTKQRTMGKAIRRKIVYKDTKDHEETRQVMMRLTRRFASYLKHKERGKKDRRAICSAGMFLRMFLRIIEDFHLLLAKSVTGSTISIGGEEKKLKITNNLSLNTLANSPADYIVQGTEDASKWNECLAPSAFALMHYYFFDPLTRSTLGLPEVSQWGSLFSQIARTGNLFMALKQIQIGSGVQVSNKSHYSRIRWIDEDRDKMSESTKQWYDEISHRFDKDREFLNASPGMLMGMLNAGSTTLGLLAVNHRMDQNQMKVITLRSSDDSMSLYLGDSMENLITCINKNKHNLGLIGINLSPDKTFMFPEGLGEYTSWYMDSKFVSQYGVETASLRPQGKNPNDDFYAVAKGTSTALNTLTINPMGASARLRLGIMGVKRLWRTKKRENIGMINSKVLSICDGGDVLWTCMNSHLDDTALREMHAQTEEEKEYLLRLRNPDNPFNEQEVEEVTFSRAEGTMVLDKIENPKNIFSFLKRSNRTFKGADKKKQEEEEKANAEAVRIIRNIDLPTLIDYPTSSAPISDNLKTILKMQRQNFDLTDQEQADYERALNLLDRPEPDEEDDFQDDDLDSD